jgi:hypothetical protein
MSGWVLNVMNFLNQDAVELGFKLITLAHGYHSHASALDIAFNKQILKNIEYSNILSDKVGTVRRKDGEMYQFLKLGWLAHDGFNIHIKDDLERVWLIGALIFAGDSLSSFEYFDRSPGLEMVRHIRNAAAHNNRFKIDKPEQLIKFPAHTRLSTRSHPVSSVFEITPDLDGKSFMWEYMEAGDILDVIYSAGYYLQETFGS